jgi:hypothetical protein
MTEVPLRDGDGDAVDLQRHHSVSETRAGVP